MTETAKGPKKRGQRGEGTFRVVSEPGVKPVRVRWEIVVKLPSGRKERLSGNVSHPTHEDRAISAAKDARSKAKHKAESQGVTTDKNLTMKQLMAAWLAYKKASLKPKTYDSYRSIIDLYVSPGAYLGEKKVREVSIATLQDWHTELAKTGHQRTRAMAHQRVSQALDYAEGRGVIFKNPAKNDLARPQGVTTVQDRGAYTPMEMALLIRAGRADKTVFGRMTALFLLTGMRRVELVALRWSDIKAGALRLHDTMDNLGRSDGTMKTTSSKRPLPLSAAALEVLKEAKAFQQQQREKAGDKWEDTDYVFTTKTGGHQWADNWGRHDVKLHKGLGIVRRTLHEKRSTWATTALNQGVPLSTVSAQLGHKNQNITLRAYAKNLEEMAARVVTLNLPDLDLEGELGQG